MFKIVEKYSNNIVDWFDAKEKSSIKWSELKDLLGVSDYIDFVEVVRSLTKKGMLKGVGCSFNKKSPALHLKYTLGEELEKERIGGTVNDNGLSKE